MHLLISTILICIAIFLLGLGALSLRVLYVLLTTGPRATNQAYESGASLSKWWAGKYWPITPWRQKI
jgi:hypothetical protein